MRMSRQFDNDDELDQQIPVAVVPPKVAEEVAREAARETMERGADSLAKNGPPSPALIGAEAFAEGMNRLLRGDQYGTDAMAALKRQGETFATSWSSAAGAGAGLWAQYEAEESAKDMLRSENPSPNDEPQVHMRVVPGSGDAVAVLTAGKASASAITLVAPDGKARQVDPAKIGVDELADLVAHGGSVRFHMDQDALATFAGRASLAGVQVAIGKDRRPLEADVIIGAARQSMARAIFDEDEEALKLLAKISNATKDPNVPILKRTAPLFRQALALRDGRYGPPEVLAEVVDDSALRQHFLEAADRHALAQTKALRIGMAPEDAALVARGGVMEGERAPRLVMRVQETDEEARSRGERLARFAEAVGSSQEKLPAEVVFPSVDRLLSADGPRVFPHKGAGVADWPGHQEHGGHVVTILERVAAGYDIEPERAQTWAGRVRQMATQMGGADPKWSDLQGRLGVVADALDHQAGGSATAETWVVSGTAAAPQFVMGASRAEASAAAVIAKLADTAHGADQVWGDQAEDRQGLGHFLALAPQALYDKKFQVVDRPALVEDAVRYLGEVAKGVDRMTPEERREATGLAEQLAADAQWMDRVREPWWADIHGQLNGVVETLSPSAKAAASPAAEEQFHAMLKELPVKAAHGLRSLAGWVIESDWPVGQGISSSEGTYKMRELLTQGDVEFVPAGEDALGRRRDAYLRLGSNFQSRVPEIADGVQRHQDEQEAQDEQDRMLAAQDSARSSPGDD